MNKQVEGVQNNRDRHTDNPIVIQMDCCPDGQIIQHSDCWTDAVMDKQMEGWMDREMDREMDRKTDRWIDGFK